MHKKQTISGLGFFNQILQHHKVKLNLAVLDKVGFIYDPNALTDKDLFKLEDDTRRRVPSSFSHKKGTRLLCGAKAGPAKHLSLLMRETNRRLFWARCGDDPLQIILDNQHPWLQIKATEE